jgi:quinol monooxygenase YgiN
MVLATAKVADFDRFWNVFSTKGAEKRKAHGCKGAHVFRDPNESDRVWAIFDWDEAGWQSFTSDPDVPAIFQEAGFTQGPPKSAEFLRETFAETRRCRG